MSEEESYVRGEYPVVLEHAMTGSYSNRTTEEVIFSTPVLGT